MSGEVSFDHINPTARERALIDQYNKALEVVGETAAERDRLRTALVACRDALVKSNDELENFSIWINALVSDGRKPANCVAERIAQNESVITLTNSILSQ